MQSLQSLHNSESISIVPDGTKPPLDQRLKFLDLANIFYYKV